MTSHTEFEVDIQKAISNKTESIYPSEDMFSEMVKKLEGGKEREHIINTRKLKNSRGALVACVILILTTATCFAAIKIGPMSGSGTTYTVAFPSETEIENAAGFVPKHIENFSNGAMFQRSSAGQRTGDVEGVAFTAEELDMVYVKGDMKIFVTAVNKAGLMSYTKEEIQAFLELNDQSVAELAFLESDIKGMYLVDKDLPESHASLYWEEEGITYDISCLNHQDACLDQKEMEEMANEIIMSR